MDESAMLSKVVVQAAASLDLAAEELAGMLGISESDAADLMKSGAYRLSRERPDEWDRALLVTRLYAVLIAVWGTAARAWLRSPNTLLGGTPLELAATAAGLQRVVDYIDDAARRP